MRLRPDGPRVLAALSLLAMLAVDPATNARAANAPDWLARAARVPVPEDLARGKAVVLLREEEVMVDESGTARSVHRCAIKILTPEGRSSAVGSRHYLTGSGKIHSMKGWVIRVSGSVKELSKSDVVDMAVVNNDVYNESRIRSMIASQEVEPGAIFGYECQSEDRSILREFEWYFQDELPTLRSRFSLTTPRDWTVRSLTFNRDEVRPSASGETRTWELADLPPVPEEPKSPPLNAVVPRLAVSVFTSPRNAGSIHAFDRWEALGVWLSDLTEPQATPSPELTKKANELVAGTPDEVARIQAMASFVQAIPYISIQLGVGRGGGYCPRPAAEVFSKAYGDCKDKANLLRTMLGVVGIPAHLVLVFSGDRYHVREAWPAAQQFNHCLTAIRVTGPIDGPTIDHPKLGRLLVFDPTDPSTLLGDLPESEQGSLALLVTREPGSLVRLPVLPAGQNRASRTNEVVLGADGSIQMTLHERSTGQSGAGERRLYRSLARPDYVERIESWVVGGAPQAKLARVKPVDHREQGAFELAVEFSAPRYARLLEGRLLLFRPAILDRWDWVPLTESVRHLPVSLEERTFEESSRFVLPDGYGVDELPDSVRIETSFGTYMSRVEVGANPGELRMRRELTIRSQVIPASEYPGVRSFYDRVRSAEQAMVVLAKK